MLSWETIEQIDLVTRRVRYKLIEIPIDVPLQLLHPLKRQVACSIFLMLIEGE